MSGVSPLIQSKTSTRSNDAQRINTLADFSTVLPKFASPFQSALHYSLREYRVDGSAELGERPLTNLPLGLNVRVNKRF
jgi:hypothetical protein